MKVSRIQAAENRERILDVATMLFRERGIDGIGVADLMKAAGLTHGGFYGHFKSKEDLVAQACARAVDKDAAELDQHRRSCNRRSPRSARRNLPHPEASRQPRPRMRHGCSRLRDRPSGTLRSSRLHRRAQTLPRLPLPYRSREVQPPSPQKSPRCLRQLSSAHLSSPAPSTILNSPTKSSAAAAATMHDTDVEQVVERSSNRRHTSAIEAPQLQASLGKIREARKTLFNKQ